jgi:hypothetical protein
MLSPELSRLEIYLLIFILGLVLLVTGYNFWVLLFIEWIKAVFISKLFLESIADVEVNL